MLWARAMGNPLRWFVPGLVYEVTTRTIQERFLIRPGDTSRDLILGVLGRGLALYPSVRLHAFAYLSNHSHLLLSSDDGNEFVLFLGFVNGNVARELGRLHGWQGPFWGRRCRPVPVLDDDALVMRLRYVLAQGVKEGLVASPRDWPGATSTPALLGESRLSGTWVHRDLQTRALRRTTPEPATSYMVAYDVPVTPIPPWERCTPEELVTRHRQLVEDIEAEHQASKPLGADAVRCVDPHARPTAPARRPAPLCHASRPGLRAAFKAAYRSFVNAFREATAATREAIHRTWPSVFPPGSFPRPRIATPGTLSTLSDLAIAVSRCPNIGRGTP